MWMAHENSCNDRFLFTNAFLWILWKLVAKAISSSHKWNMFGPLNQGGFFFFYLGYTSDLCFSIQKLGKKNCRNTSKSKPSALTATETTLTSKWSVMESPQTTFSHHCLAHRAADHRLQARPCQAWPWMPSPQPAMAEQGKSHSNAIPQSEVQTRTIDMAWAYSELGPFNTNMYESDCHCDWYKLSYVDNHLHMCVYLYLHIYFRLVF